MGPSGHRCPKDQPGLLALTNEGGAGMGWAAPGGAPEDHRGRGRSHWFGSVVEYTVEGKAGPIPCPPGDCKDQNDIFNVLHGSTLAILD